MARPEPSFFPWPTDVAASTESLTVRLLRWSATALLVGTWSIAKFTRPRRGALIALESGITLVLVFVYIKLGSLYFVGEDRFGPGSQTGR